MSTDLSLYEEMLSEPASPDKISVEIDESEKSMLLKTINDLTNENQSFQKENGVYRDVIKKLEAEKDSIIHNFKGLIIVSRREIKRLTMKEAFLTKKLKRHGLYAHMGIKKKPNKFQSLEDIPVNEEMEYSALLDCIRSGNDFKEEKDEKRPKLTDSNDVNKPMTISSPDNSQILPDAVQQEAVYPPVKSTEELIEAVDNILDSTAYQVIDYLMRHKSTAEEWFQKNSTRFSTDGKHLSISKDNRALRSLNASSPMRAASQKFENKKPLDTDNDKMRKPHSRDRGRTTTSSSKHHEQKSTKESANKNNYSKRSYHLYNPAVSECTPDFLSPNCRGAIAGKLKLLAKTPPSGEDEDVENKSMEDSLPAKSRCLISQFCDKNDNNSKVRSRNQNDKDFRKSSHETSSRVNKKSSSQHHTKDASSHSSPLSKARKKHDRDDIPKSSHHSKSPQEKFDALRRSSKNEKSTSRSNSKVISSFSKRNSHSPCSHKSRKSSFYESKDSSRGVSNFKHSSDSTRYSSRHSSQSKSFDNRKGDIMLKEDADNQLIKSSIKAPDSPTSKSSHSCSSTNARKNTEQKSTKSKKLSKSSDKSQNLESEEKSFLDSDLEIVSYWSDSSYASRKKSKTNATDTSANSKSQLGKSTEPLKSQSLEKSYPDKSKKGTKFFEQNGLIEKRTNFKQSSPNHSSTKSQYSEHSAAESHTSGPEIDFSKTKHNAKNQLMNKPCQKKITSSSCESVVKVDNSTGLENFESRLLALYDKSMQQVRENNQVKKHLSSLSGQVPTEEEKLSINKYYNDLEDGVCAENSLINEDGKKITEVPVETTLFTKRMRDKFVRKVENSHADGEIKDTVNQESNPLEFESLTNKDDLDLNKEEEIELDYLQLISSPQISLERGLKSSDDELDEQLLEEVVTTAHPDNIESAEFAEEIVIDETNDIDAEEGEILESDENESQPDRLTKSDNNGKSHSHKKRSHHHSSTALKSTISKSTNVKKRAGASVIKFHRHSVIVRDESLNNKKDHRIENQQKCRQSKCDPTTAKSTNSRMKETLTSSIRKSSKDRRHSPSKSKRSNSEDKQQRLPCSQKSHHSESGKSKAHSRSSRSSPPPPPPPKKPDANSRQRNRCKPRDGKVNDTSSSKLKRRSSEQPILRPKVDYLHDEEVWDEWESDVENQPVVDTTLSQAATSPIKCYRKRHRSRSGSNSNSLLLDRLSSKVSRK